MSKTFRPWKIDEPLLLPVTVADFVSESHLARFVLSVVRDEVDLCKITGSYGSEFGQPPFNPVMMTTLLLYAYCSGIYSSRRIAKASGERVDFMSLVGLDVPDFRTISDFRKRHLRALSDLFKQVLLLCEKAGLVKLGHVALDGTKVKANALQAQGDELWAHGGACHGTGSRGCRLAQRRRSGGRRRGQVAWPRQAWRRNAGLGRGQAAACGEDPEGQGRIGGGGGGRS